MNSLPRIDFHMHTLVSDGTDTPAQVLGHVRELQLEWFSITDHDAIKGSSSIPALLKEGDPHFLSGVEFSCKDDRGKYHILGYGYDPEAEAIQKVTELGHRFRMEKLEARLDFLKSAFGIELPKEELDALYAMNNPGKPHLGHLLARLGYAENKDTAINNYINKARISPQYVHPREAIEGILQSGGIPVLAHPTFGNGSQMIRGEEMHTRILYLMDFGLKGLEAFYSGFGPEINRELLDYAERYDLYVTAGSDYHGTNKKIRIGQTGLGEEAQWPKGLRRFLEAAANK